MQRNFYFYFYFYYQSTKFNFGTEKRIISEIFKLWRWGGGGEVVLFFRTFDFLLFQIIFNQKEPLNFFLLLFQIIFNQKELFFKKGTIGKVWYIAIFFEPKCYFLAPRYWRSSRHCCCISGHRRSSGHRCCISGHWRSSDKILWRNPSKNNH